MTPLEALQALVEHARPSFPKTPYRKALDDAKRVLAEEDKRNETAKRPARGASAGSGGA